MKNQKLTLLVVMLIGASLVSFCQPRTTTQAGSWNNTATWGGASVPNSAAFGIITVNHAVAINAVDFPIATPLTVDQVVVRAAGSITVNSGAGFRIVSVAGVDLNVNNTGAVTFKSGSEFQIGAGVTFTTTVTNTIFEAGSVVRTSATNMPISSGLNSIDVYIEGLTAGFTINNTWNQLGANTNLYINCPALGINVINFVGGIITSLKSLNILDTNGDAGGRVTLTTNGTGTLSVGAGGVNISGLSCLYMTTSGNSTLNVIGDFIFSSTSTMYSQMVSGQVLATPIATINMNGGDFIMASGLWRVAGSGNNGTAFINFNSPTSDMLVSGGLISVCP